MVISLCRYHVHTRVTRGALGLIITRLDRRHWSGYALSHRFPSADALLRAAQLICIENTAVTCVGETLRHSTTYWCSLCSTLDQCMRRKISQRIKGTPYWKYTYCHSFILSCHFLHFHTKMKHTNLHVLDVFRFRQNKGDDLFSWFHSLYFVTI